MNNENQLLIALSEQIGTYHTAWAQNKESITFESANRKLWQQIFANRETNVVIDYQISVPCRSNLHKVVMALLRSTIIADKPLVWIVPKTAEWAEPIRKQLQSCNAKVYYSYQDALKNYKPGKKSEQYFIFVGNSGIRTNNILNALDADGKRGKRPACIFLNEHPLKNYTYPNIYSWEWSSIEVLLLNKKAETTFLNLHKVVVPTESTNAFGNTTNLIELYEKAAQLLNEFTKTYNVHKLKSFINACLRYTFPYKDKEHENYSNILDLFEELILWVKSEEATYRFEEAGVWEIDERIELLYEDELLDAFWSICEYFRYQNPKYDAMQKLTHKHRKAWLSLLTSYDKTITVNKKWWENKNTKCGVAPFFKREKEDYTIEGFVNDAKIYSISADKEIVYYFPFLFSDEQLEIMLHLAGPKYVFLYDQIEDWRYEEFMHRLAKKTVAQIQARDKNFWGTPEFSYRVPASTAKKSTHLTQNNAQPPSLDATGQAEPARKPDTKPHSPAVPSISPTLRNPFTYLFSYEEEEFLAENRSYDDEFTAENKPKSDYVREIEYVFSFKEAEVAPKSYGGKSGKVFVEYDHLGNLVMQYVHPADVCEGSVIRIYENNDTDIYRLIKKYETGKSDSLTERIDKASMSWKGALEDLFVLCGRNEHKLVEVFERERYKVNISTLKNWLDTSTKGTKFPDDDKVFQVIQNGLANPEFSRRMKQCFDISEHPFTKDSKVIERIIHYRNKFRSLSVSSGHNFSTNLFSYLVSNQRNGLLQELNDEQVGFLVDASLVRATIVEVQKNILTL